MTHLVLVKKASLRSLRLAVLADSTLRSISIGNVAHGPVIWADVICTGSNDSVVGTLFHDVRGPASDSGHNEYGSKQFGWNAHKVISRRVEEVSITE